MDTLRFDAFTEEWMPETLAVLQGGQVFSNFYSSTSTTQPTHATLLTGLHPWEHGVTRNGLVLDDSFVTLPEALREAGFWTSGLVTSYPLKAAYGYDQGFDAFDDGFDEDYSKTWVGEDVQGGSFYSLGASATARAQKAVMAAPDGDQFFWFHFFDPHDPYGDTPSGAGDVTVQLPALRYLGEQRDPSFEGWLPRARSQYNKDVQDLDQHLGALLRVILEDEGHRTSILLTADHGESFGEDGSLGHGDRVSSGQVHVPMVLWVPDGTPGRDGPRDEVAGTVDIAATVAELAGLGDHAFAGRSLLQPAPNGGVAFGMRRLLTEEKEELRLDGTKHLQSRPVFYAVHKGVLVAGDGDRTWLGNGPDAQQTVPDASKLQALFGVFQRSLESAGATELDSDAAQDALGVLGYGR